MSRSNKEGPRRASTHTGNPRRYANLLLATDCLREHVNQAVIEWLKLPRGSSGLDAGCGVGSQSLLLAEAVGPRGHVTGLDFSGDLLRIAGERVREAGYEKRIVLKQGDINNLPFDPDSFDWVWSADCVGPGTGGPFSQVEGLARVVRPGGTVSVMAWSFQNLLPGYPLLEARLNATSAGIAPFKPGMKPGAHLLRAKAWFTGAGLQEVTAKSFIGDIQAPLDDASRNAMMLLFDMRWGSAPEGIGEDDRALYDRLTTCSSSEFILDQPGYYAFFTYTVFQGRKPHAIPDSEKAL